MRIDALKRVGRTVSLYLHHCFFKSAQCSVKSDPFSLGSLSWGKESKAGIQLYDRPRLQAHSQRYQYEAHPPADTSTEPT